MTFVRKNPLGWALFEILTSGQMNGIDIDQTFALDGRDGGGYSPLATLVLTGGADFVIPFKAVGGPSSTAGIAGTGAEFVGGENTSTGFGGVGFVARGGVGLVNGSTGGNCFGADGAGVGVGGTGLAGVGGVGGVTDADGGAGVSGSGGALGGSGFGGPGVRAIGAINGYGIEILADATSPGRAAMRIRPQDADPNNSPQTGDVIVTAAGHPSGTGIMRIFNGTIWETVGTQT